MQGTVTCVLWRNDKDERKSKSPWPPVSPQTVKERRTAKPIPRNEADAAKVREAAAAAERAKLEARAAAAKPAKAKSVPAAAPKPASRRTSRPSTMPSFGVTAHVHSSFFAVSFWAMTP